MPEGIAFTKCLCYSERMEIGEALRDSMKAAGMRDAHIAVAVDCSAESVAAWRKGTRIPRGDTMQHLRRVVPGFAELLDTEVARAS